MILCFGLVNGGELCILSGWKYFLFLILGDFLFMEKNFKKNKYIKIFVYVLKYFFDRRFCMFFGY